ncbi:MAG: DUF1178 family protein [Desulfobacterales bacterium]|nr:DUF1178 family protein [Desulfobacterales bacterium]
MIVFDLICTCGFTFEGWFEDRRDFESQQTAALLVCPQCGSQKVRKILSPVSSLRSGPRPAVQPPAEDRSEPSEGEKAKGARLLRAVQDFVKNNFEDVGPRLATEALKIHYGVEKPRNIRGVTTAEEEKTLEKEGINLLKVPMPAGDDGSMN